MPQYFGSKPTFTGNHDDYVHDFRNQIAGQEGVIGKAQDTYGQYKNQADTARDEYTNLIKNQQAYKDMWDEAENRYNVLGREQDYQNSLNATNATASAMNTLPSSINAGANVVLNNAQRHAALGNQMQKYLNTMDYWTRENATRQNQYQMALQRANMLAEGNYRNQRNKIADYLNRYGQTAADTQNQYQNMLNERNILRQIYGQMYDDEYHHMANELAAWQANLGAETQRYLADKEAEAQRYNADAGMRLQQYLQKQQQQRTPTFQEYLQSEAGRNAYGNDMSDEEKKDLTSGLLGRYQTASGRDLQNILEGETYQDYLKWAKGGRTMKDLGGTFINPVEAQARYERYNADQANRFADRLGRSYDSIVRDTAAGYDPMRSKKGLAMNALGLLNPITAFNSIGNFIPAYRDMKARAAVGLTGGGWNRDAYINRHLGGR